MSVVVEGTVTLGDGTASRFVVEDSHGYLQWGATNGRLGRTQPLLEKIAEAVEDFEEEEQE